MSAEVVIGARRDSALKAADAIRLSQVRRHTHSQSDYFISDHINVYINIVLIILLIPYSFTFHLLLCPRVSDYNTRYTFSCMTRVTQSKPKSKKLVFLIRLSFLMLC